ncbi:dirigent protein 22-like [Juglans microcarpa x Juglans regia]|uniref:dirigent protein 22-like n=1 Tax=Juglans microcarpa x Juglans regia TaxID=2249226 RepID=UPI001B7EE88B|nr:dirigent protein 22-like [Juglans microcarpa x Juglans regia]
MACFLIILITLCSALLNTISGAFIEESREAVAIKRDGKTTHLHFYFHDILSGKNPSAIKIAGPSQSTIFNFGNTMMIDDALTEGPALESKLVGRAQGFYALAAQNEIAMLMVMNFAFMEGEYKGSTLSILGRNPVGNDVREMPVVGGSGVFRQVHGYALAHTVLFDSNTGDATVEYNVYVSHFQPVASLARHGMKPGQHALFFVLFIYLFFVFGLNNSFTSKYV